MGDWSLLEGQLVDTVGEVLASSRGTTVTTGAVNTKGDWTQIIASTTYAADGMLISFASGGLSSGTDFLVDIAVGGAGSEVILIPDLFSGHRLTRQVGTYFIPIGVPIGTALSARAQCLTAANNMFLTIGLLSQGFLPSAPLGRVTAYGVNTGDSGGTNVDPGAVANTKNAYSQIIAATTNPTRALLVVIGGQNNSTRTSCDWLVDVAIGAAGSERIIMPDLYLGCHSSSDEIWPTVLGPFPIDIPAGVRLAARAQCSINDAEDRLFDIALYGID